MTLVADSITTQKPFRDFALDAELLEAVQVERAAALFLRDGFVAIRDALTPKQLAFAQRGAKRVVDEQTQAIKLEDANRGFARYSFGDQMQHSEWQQLIDLPTILPIIEKIWNSDRFRCTGGGGDYSIPGAEIQRLHSDLGDSLADPLGQTSIRDLPTPFIVVNFLMTEFKEVNGAIRFIPGTQRSRVPIPTLEEEPESMKRSILCAPVGTAIIRDVRCWHGGTANRSKNPRIMTSVGYSAPWFNLNRTRSIPLDRYRKLSARAQRLARELIKLPE